MFRERVTPHTVDASWTVNPASDSPPLEVLGWRLVRGRQSVRVAGGDGLDTRMQGRSDRRGTILAQPIDAMARHRATDLGGACRQREVSVTPPRHADVHGSSCVSARSTTDPGTTPERASDAHRSSQLPHTHEAQAFNKSPLRGTPRYRFAIRRSPAVCGSEPAPRQGGLRARQSARTRTRVDRVRLGTSTATRRL